MGPNARESGIPPSRSLPGASLRDKLFYVAFVAVFTALSAGTAFVAPVLSYDCQRDAGAVVSCTVHSRMYGVVPLPARRLAPIVAATCETSETSSEDRTGGVYRRFLHTHQVLVLARADGTRWRSLRSTEPLGQSNCDMAGGIDDLLKVTSPKAFHAWTGEKVPLLVAWTFLAPLAIILLALAARAWLFRGQKAEQLYADLQPIAARKLAATLGAMSAGDPCGNQTCPGTITEQGVCDTCGAPAPGRV